MSLNVSNGYVPKYTPIKDRDFLSYLDDLKFEKFMENPDQSFRNTKIVIHIVISYIMNVAAINLLILMSIIKQFLRIILRITLKEIKKLYCLVR